MAKVRRIVNSGSAEGTLHSCPACGAVAYMHPRGIWTCSCDRAQMIPVSGVSGDSATITADSKPDYDAFGWDSHWNCDEWVDWWEAMEKKYSAAEADSRWSAAWLAGLSRSSGGKGTAPGSGQFFDSVPVECRTFSPRFSNLLRERAVLYETVYRGVGGFVAKPLGAANELLTAIHSLASNAARNPLLAAGIVGGALLAFYGPPSRLTRKRRKNR